MKYEFTPSDVCSRNIIFEIDANDKITDVRFEGGCHGNLQGIAALLRGMQRTEAIGRLKGIRCGNKATSCPDQLAQALEQAR